MRDGAGDPAALTGMRGEAMREPDEVAAMVRLHALGWGVRRIAAELGCSHTTVRRYLAARRGGPGRSTACRNGWPSGSGGTGATPTWCGRTSRASAGCG